MNKARLRRKIDALRLGADRVARGARHAPSGIHPWVYSVAEEMQAEAYALEAELYRLIGDSAAESNFNRRAAHSRVAAQAGREAAWRFIEEAA